MTHETFNLYVDELEKNRVSTLKEKNAKYSSENDALYNFRRGAEIMNCTIPQCVLGYMTKHFAALVKMIEADDFHDLDDVLEKCQDIQNYISFIWAAACEERESLETHESL